MNEKRIPWIVACGLLCAGIGCHHKIKSVSVGPGFTPFEQAKAGDILEWNALNSQTGSFWIVFSGESPCKERVIKGDPSTPAQCKVTQPRGFYEYGVTLNPPPTADPPPGPHPAGGVPVHCRQCLIAIVPPKKPGKQPTGTPVHRTTNPANDTANPSLITCKGGIASADDASKPDGDVVWWVPLGNYRPWTVKFDDPSACGGANGQGVFTDEAVCTVTGKPSPDPYTYTVHFDGCGTDGKGKLTITEPPSQ